MSQIAQNFETVGISDTASVSIDVDAMVRKAMIKLFELKDANGNQMNEYDNAYFDAGLPTTDEPGMPSLTKSFIIFETETLSFLFQQVLYILTPIKTALELPQLLTNPKALIEKIKEIIDNVKKMIDDVTTFLTDTKQWFIDTLLGGLADINIPIPEITITILGVDITLPKIDKKGLFDTDTYKEKLDGKAGELKTKITDLKKELSQIKDKANENISKLQDNVLVSLQELKTQLNAILYQIVYEYYELSYQLHEKILEKENLAVIYMNNNNIGYISTDIVNRTNDILLIKTELDNITNKDGLKIFNDTIVRLIEIPSDLTSILTNEIESLTTLITNKNIVLVTTEIDDTIETLKNSISEKLTEMIQPQDDLIKNQEGIDKILASVKNFTGNLTLRKKQIEDKIKETYDELVNLSPATAWIQKMIDLFLNIIKAPIDFIIALITKLMEGVIEFLKELPLPTFTKFKEFFSDLLGLANVSKMSDFVNSLLESLAPLANPDLIAKISEFLPDLIVTIGVKFITSIVEPLPIPI